MIKKLYEEMNKETKILSNFINHKKIDKLIRLRAASQGKEKSDIVREALIEYFNKYPITKQEKEILNN